MMAKETIVFIFDGIPEDTKAIYREDETHLYIGYNRLWYNSDQQAIEATLKERIKTPA